ncbi:MAG: transglutaminase-like domain-containing protein [Desulfobacterota bacterium]|nr:transglutaminase-like domain-containing protein [Thermodesulfobacteriota bacterium]
MERETNLRFLLPTAIIDSHHPSVIGFAKEVIGSSKDPVEMAVKLYLAVRDGIRYDPYSPFYLPEHYRASFVLKRGRSFCVPKASLLCALGRACGIPSRVGLATVRNHLATQQLLDFLGTDLFVSHGFVEFYLEGKWVKATPAFNRELCLRHKVVPLEFNGREDSLFQPYNLEKQKFMEYVRLEGIYEDIPVEHILAEWKAAYGEERVNRWIKRFEEGSHPLRDFETEDVINP